MNDFIKFNTMSAGANGVQTENGAVSYATFGTEIMDQFGKAGCYRGRDIDTVWDEQARLWAENPDIAIKFPFYLRMITRQQKTLDSVTEKTQIGQGAKDEAFKRLLWVAKFHPETFYKNLVFLPIVGSWKDLWVLMAFDGADEYLDNKKFFKVISEGILSKSHKDLVKKYMPRIRSNNRCKTAWAMRTNALAKEFAKTVGWTYNDYRKFKSTGVAHEFQKVICGGLFDKINWNAIPGKALLNLVNGRFLENHDLVDSYLKWLETQTSVKFNGYPYELGRKFRTFGHLTRVQKFTIDKQFENLIQTAKSNGTPINGNVLCALDTSASMTWYELDKSGTQAYDVCLSLGIYFSELNTGSFHNVVAEFSETSKLLTINGSFTDKWVQLQQKCHGWGSTNFQSVIDMLVNTRKKDPTIPLEDYPTTLLVVSDMQFNPTSGNTETNYQAAMRKLSEVFPKEYVDNFKIIWWYCCAGRKTNDFPSTMDDAGTYMISGFDGAAISFILGGDTTDDNERKVMSMEEVINKALSQEILTFITQ